MRPLTEASLSYSAFVKDLISRCCDDRLARQIFPLIEDRLESGPKPEENSFDSEPQVGRDIFRD